MKASFARDMLFALDRVSTWLPVEAWIALTAAFVMLLLVLVFNDEREPEQPKDGRWQAPPLPARESPAATVGAAELKKER